MTATPTPTHVAYHDGVYEEIYVENGARPAPVRFPVACPACQAPVKFTQSAGQPWASRTYRCGGAYTSKPQVQNHTHVWWGSCPKAKVANLVGLAHDTPDGALHDKLIDAGHDPADYRDDTGWVAPKPRPATSQRGQPVTRDNVVAARNFEHVRLKNADGTPLRCRASGACKTWKTRPHDFRQPVKHGLRHSFYITPDNAADWVVVS